MPAGGVGLVCAQGRRLGAGPSRAASGRAQLGQKQWQHREIARLAWSDDQHQRPPVPVDQRVRLGGQPTPAPADRVIGGLVRFARSTSPIIEVRRFPVCELGPDVHLAAVAPCWCTRAIVESTDTRQSMPPAASASVCNAARTRCQVSSPDHR
jgi:hypothetical protein